MGRRALAAVRSLNERFEASLRLNSLEEMGYDWRSFLPEACLGIGVFLAFLATLWLVVAWPPATAFFATAAFNGLLLLALWFILMPFFVVLVVYALKAALWAWRR